MRVAQSSNRSAAIRKSIFDICSLSRGLGVFNLAVPSKVNTFGINTNFGHPFLATRPPAYHITIIGG